MIIRAARILVPRVSFVTRAVFSRTVTGIQATWSRVVALPVLSYAFPMLFQCFPYAFLRGSGAAPFWGVLGVYRVAK